MTDLVLYELEGCPFCLRVQRKLNDLGLEYESRKVPSAHAERTEVLEISNQTGVPVLIDKEHGIEGMPESSDIVEYLEETYGEETQSVA